MEQVSALPGPQFPHVIDEACGRSSRGFYCRDGGDRAGRQGRVGPTCQVARQRLQSR